MTTFIRFIMISLLILSFFPSLAQITIQFDKESATTQEIDKETIRLPIVISGKWPEGLSDFSIIIKTTGNASENYDYKIDRKELKISKNEMANPVCSITINSDDLFDDKEDIIVTLSTNIDDKKKVNIVEGKESFTIQIRDRNEFLTELLRRVNNDADTSERVGTLKLNPNVQFPTLYTLRLSSLSGSSKSKKNDVSNSSRLADTSSLSKDTALQRTIASETQDKEYSKQVESYMPLEKINTKIDTANIYEYKLSYLRVRIKKVEVSINSGVISDIKVYTDIEQKDPVSDIYRKVTTEIFTNLAALNGVEIVDQRNQTTDIVYRRKRIPIPIRHLMFDSRVGEIKLYGVGLSQGRFKYDFLKFKEVLFYEPDLDNNYPPGNIRSIILSPEAGNQEKILTTRTSLQSYINLNIYTDFLSLIKAERGNGLVQTEASAHILLNTKNNYNSFSYWVNYLEPYLKYSRFDNGYNFVARDTLMPNTYSVDRSLLYQRSFLNAGIKINIIRWINRFNNEFEINSLTQFDWANVRGPQLSQTDKNRAPEYELERLNMFSLGTELRYKTVLYRNFGLYSSWKSWHQELWNRPSFVNSKWSWYHSPEFELFYFPIATSEDKIFIRFRTVLTTFETDRNFVQLQVGYKGQFKFKAK